MGNMSGVSAPYVANLRCYQLRLLTSLHNRKGKFATLFGHMRHFVVLEFVLYDFFRRSWLCREYVFVICAIQTSQAATSMRTDEERMATMKTRIWNCTVALMTACLTVLSFFLIIDFSFECSVHALSSLGLVTNIHLGDISAIR